TIKRKSHARSPDTRTIARARPSWLGERVQGTRTKIRSARPRARGMARPASRIRNDAAPAETLRNARQSGLVARRFRKARRRRLGINYATLTKLACPSLRVRLSDLIAMATSVTRRASSRDFKVSPMTRL